MYLKADVSFRIVLKSNSIKNDQENLILILCCVCSYGIYSPETGTVTDEQKIEVPLEDNHGQQLSKVITGLRPGILYAFRVYAENGVGVTYSGYQTVKIPVE